MVLQKLSGVVGNVFFNIFPSNINITICFCLQDLIKMVRLLLAVVSISGFRRIKAGTLITLLYAALCNTYVIILMQLK